MPVRDEIEAIDSAYEKGVANRDIAAITELYAANAYFLPPNEPMAVGREAIAEVGQRYLDAGAQSLDLETTTVAEFGDAVVEVGTYRLGLQAPGGEPVTDVGKYLQVLTRQPDGSLRIMYDAFNSDQPAG